MTAGGGEIALHWFAACHNKCMLIERQDPTGGMTAGVLVIGPDMQKTLVGDALDHEADFIGMRHQREASAATADTGKNVIDAGTANLLGRLLPAVEDPILDSIFMAGRTRELSEGPDQRKRLGFVGHSSPGNAFR